MKTTEQARSGFTLVEVVVSSAVLTIALFAMYGAVATGYSMICNAQQRLDAEALAFDKAVEVFDTTYFAGITSATSFPVQPVPLYSVLPTNSTICVAVFPNLDTATPYKWDIEVRVKRGRVWPGRPIDSNTDVRAIVTRYAVERN
jgi:prepilin-type N-terminal cleavage/methylation domain-containing protein